MNQQRVNFHKVTFFSAKLGAAIGADPMTER